MTGADVVTEARRWLGVPYVHQGRTRYGVDCIGLVICVRHAVEAWPAALREVRNYARRPADALLVDRIAAHCQRIEAPEDGCVILVRWPNHAHATHTALYAGGHLIHAYQFAGRVVETGHRAHWLRDTDSYWRLPGVA